VPDAAPLILALETATNRASAALLRAEQVIAVARSDTERHHAEAILGILDAVFEQAGVALPAVEAFAVAVGPGGFTSLRVGLSTVKGLAFGSALPVAGISTLAAQVAAVDGQGEPLLSVLDARRGELYAGLFADPERAPMLAEGVYRPAELPALPASTALCGHGVAALAPALREATGLALPVRPAFESLVAAVGRLGARALARGEGQSAAGLEPRYLRRSQAEEVAASGG